MVNDDVVENKGTVRQQPVKLGITIDDKTEVVDGLKTGQTVVAKGQTLLSDGAKVNIVSIVE